MFPLSQVEFEIDALKWWLFMWFWVSDLNFHEDGGPLKPNRIPNIRRDVDLMKEMAGEMRFLTSSSFRVDVTLVDCGSLLFHG